MEELLQWMEYMEDIHQERKVHHLLKDVLVIVLFATLSNADDWMEIALFVETYQDYLRKYIELKNGSPSHLVSAWSKEDGFCLGQKAVEEKRNEITAIPELLEKLQIKGQIITIDVMGTLHEELIEYFGDKQLCQRIKEAEGYKRTQEKAHGQIKTREYYQTEDIK